MITPEQLRAAFRIAAPYYSPTLEEMQSIFAEFQKLKDAEYRVVAQANRDYIDELKDERDELTVKLKEQAEHEPVAYRWKDSLTGKWVLEENDPGMGNHF